MDLITFDHFSFRYASQTESTLKDIHLTIPKGQKLLILGQSGSGKSTLVHCINGLIPHSYEGEIQGSLSIDQENTQALSLFQISQKVGTVLQDSDAQFVALSVEDDVAFVLENQAMPRTTMIPKVHSALSKVGMEAFLKQLPFSLSGGQKQKVSLAGVLHEEAGILIFDEPLASLDPKSGEKTIELIDALSGDHTVIIVEHRLEDVLFRKVDRVLVMSEGSVIYDGSADALLKSDVLNKAGLREPLYVSALKQNKIDLRTIEHLDQIESIDFSKYQDRFRSYQNVKAKGKKSFTKTLIDVQNISFAYDTEAVLKDISFKVYQGERLAFVGQNGAGKSTLAKLLTGVVRPKHGSILLNEEDLSIYSIKEIGEKIGYVMQNPNQMLVKHLIRDEVGLALSLRGKTQTEIEERVKQALDICGLYSMRNWPVSAISYGQRKRVTVAAILALQPDILILDEPTAGQDYKHYSEIMNFLDALNQSQGITFIFITHDMHLALEYTDRALVFSEGQLLADDAIENIFSRPDLLDKAYLKQTSLYTLAKACDLDAQSFIRAFIDHRGDA